MRRSSGSRPAMAGAPQSRERLARHRPVPGVDQEPMRMLAESALPARKTASRVVGRAFEVPPAPAGLLCDDLRPFPDAALPRLHEASADVLATASGAPTLPPETSAAELGAALRRARSWHRSRVLLLVLALAGLDAALTLRWTSGSFLAKASATVAVLLVVAAPGPFRSRDSHGPCRPAGTYRR